MTFIRDNTTGVRGSKRALTVSRFIGQWDGGPVASGVTYSLSAANAATSIASGYTYQAVVSTLASPHFTFWGGNPVRNGASYPNDLLITYDSLHVDNGSIPREFECWHRGRYLEWIVLGNGHKNQIYVNGRPLTLLTSSQSPSLTTPSDGSFYRVILDFGSVDYRRVALRTLNLFGGVTVGATDTVHPVSKVGVPRCVIIGDSFTEGTGATDPWLGYPTLIGDALGVDMWVSGSGGTGYLATNGVRGTFRSRIVADCLNYSPDIVIVAGGINDGGSSAAAVQAEAETLYAQILAALPNVRLIVVSPFSQTGSPTGTQTGIAAAIKAAAATYGLSYVDLFDPLLWRGTGHAGSPTGSGNCDIITSSDTTHPTTAGHQILAARIYEQIIRVL